MQRENPSTLHALYARMMHGKSSAVVSLFARACANKSMGHCKGAVGNGIAFFDGRDGVEQEARCLHTSQSKWFCASGFVRQGFTFARSNCDGVNGVRLRPKRTRNLLPQAGPANSFQRSWRPPARSLLSESKWFGSDNRTCRFTSRHQDAIQLTWRHRVTNKRAALVRTCPRHARTPACRTSQCSSPNRRFPFLTCARCGLQQQ